MIVVIPCGGKKRMIPCPAREMYIGLYHKACQRYALLLTGGDWSKILILSAEYGLLQGDQEIAPYELRMSHPGSVSVAVVRYQAQALGLLEEKVVALGGKDYTLVCRAVWPHCTTPLAGIGGIGKQLGWMKRACG